MTGVCSSGVKSVDPSQREAMKAARLFDDLPGLALAFPIGDLGQLYCQELSCINGSKLIVYVACQSSSDKMQHGSESAPISTGRAQPVRCTRVGGVCPQMRLSVGIPGTCRRHPPGPVP